MNALPETNIAPENGWLEYDRFLLGWPIFRCELLVSGSVSHYLRSGFNKTIQTVVGNGISEPSTVFVGIQGTPPKATPPNK